MASGRPETMEHAVLLGTRAYLAQDCHAVLAHFAGSGDAGRCAYRTFIAASAFPDGGDLDGGGLRRSRGWRKVPALPRGRERWTFDERILGSGPFVERILAQLAAPGAPVATAHPRAVVATYLVYAARGRARRRPR